MKYTKQLLSRYISGSYDLETVCRELTLKSCEVEEYIERTIPELVVIGKVLSCEKHPDADKLTVCQLDCGNKGHFQICTGATNIREQIYVPVALPGCFLPAIHLQIDPRMMRGLESNGMICSKEELGINEELGSHGIWILQDVKEPMGPSDFSDIDDNDLGTPLVQFAPWLENWMLDVENKTITHRPDMFGHFGLAREINALFPDQIRFTRLPSIGEQIAPATLLHTLQQAKQATREIHIDSPYVGVYSIIELDGVVVKESGLRQRLHLLDVGLTSRNNRVDFSNYFMYLSGQPIHCFDADQLVGTITVRQAYAGERFVDLFDTEHELHEQDIVICDEQGIVALAGVVGGKRSGISTTTTRIVIELAQFDPVVVRKTAMRLGIRTDAQTRFEKHISPGFSLASILLCCDELEYLGKQELGNWTITGVKSWIDPMYHTGLVRTVPFEPALINRTLGEELSEAEMVTILSRLGIVSGTSSKSMLQVPVRRGVDDLHHTADIAEEVARIYGFDAIGTALYATPLHAVPFTKQITTIRTAEDMLRGALGYSQVETYPWLHSRWHDSFGASADLCLRMENSIAPELLYLRHTLIPSILEVIEKNAPLFSTMRIADIGAVWSKQALKKERTMLAMGRVTEKATNRQTDPFIQLKQDVITLLAEFTVDDKIIWTPSTHTRAHTTQQTDLFLGNQFIGTIAHLHPRLIDELGMSDGRSVVVAELVLDTVRDYESNNHTTYTTLQDQLIWRDISFVLPRDGQYGTVSDALAQVEEIAEVTLLDLYDGPSLAADEKSISLRFLIKGDGSLTTEQINMVMQKAIVAGEDVGAKLRQ